MMKNLENMKNQNENYYDDVEDNDDKKKLLSSNDSIIIKQQQQGNNINNMIQTEIDLNDEENNNNDETDKLLINNSALPINSINDENEVIILGSQHKIKPKFIYFIDALLSVLVFAPLSGFYWYGSWSFLDAYFIPDNVLLSSLICYISGLLIIMPGYVFQNELQRFHNRLSPKLQFLFRVTFMYICTCAVVLEWRGSWALLDKYLIMDWKGQLSLSIIAISYMLISRSFYYVLSSPFVLIMDSNFDEYFLSRSRYRFKSIESTHLQHSIDFMISEFIESFAAIISWRGIGYTIDLFLFPNNFFISVLTTIIISHGIYFILIMSQYYIYSISLRLQLIPRLIIEDIIKLFMYLSVILLWRFYWMFIDKYMYSEQYKLELFLLFHFLSFILAIIFKASISITGPACEFKDGEMSEDHTYFHISYIAALIERNNATELGGQRNRRYVYQ